MKPQEERCLMKFSLLSMALLFVVLIAISMLLGCSTYGVIRDHDEAVSEVNAQIRAGGDENEVAIALGVDIRDVRSRAMGYMAAWKSDPGAMTKAHLTDGLIIGLTAWGGKELYDQTQGDDSPSGDLVDASRAGGHTFNLNSEGGSISLQLITGGDDSNLSDAGAGASQGSGGTGNFQDHEGGSTGAP